MTKIGEIQRVTLSAQGGFAKACQQASGEAPLIAPHQIITNLNEMARAVLQGVVDSGVITLSEARNMVDVVTLAASTPAKPTEKTPIDPKQPVDLSAIFEKEMQAGCDMTALSASTPDKPTAPATKRTADPKVPVDLGAIFDREMQPA